MDKSQNEKRVLVAPLDWGLGHATRCIPIIHLLRQKGCVVMIAGSGDSLRLLKAEFPNVKTFELPAYNPVYAQDDSMVISMARQLPKFIKSIFHEHKVVQRIAKDNSVDLIISDNRYGCWSKNIRSVFITHQSNILMPKRFGWLAYIVRRMNELQVKKFHECWIPDFPGQRSLSGNLISFGKGDFHPHTYFIGALSRFRQVDIPGGSYDIVAICSGPEPQRSIFEALLKSALLNYHKKFLLIRGVLSKNETVQFENGAMVNFLTSGGLSDVLSNAKLVIARSGYSTIMDMLALQKRVIFVPTPGQTEQEYLAERLMENGIAYSMTQASFDLKKALREEVKYGGFEVMKEIHFTNDLEKQLTRVLSSI